MKIAHVIATFPPHIGGMGQVAWEEAKRLVAIGHEVTVFTLDHGKKYADVMAGVTIVHLWTPFRFGDAGLVPQLIWRLRGFDLVHLHYPWYGGAEWVWLSAKLFKIPYVLTYHMDAAPVGFFKKIVQKVYDLMWPAVLMRGAQKVIAVDREHLAASLFGSTLPTKKVAELYNGVDTTIFSPIVTSPFPTALSGWERKHIFLFVGNPLPFKRLDSIIRALALVDDIDVVLVIVGDGPGLKKYKQLAKEIGVEQRVRFVGALHDRAPLNRYYQTAQALVVAAVNAESFSLVSIEALAAGCPVIASNIPGVRSRIDPGKDGVLFSPASIAQLATEMRSFASHSPQQRATMGAYGRTKVIKCYGWEKHVSDLLNLYRAV